MLKNFWYACEFSERITHQPLRMTTLGQRLVFYRKHDGSVVCLSDLCVRRGGALSGGHLDGDCIVCPYHGWRYRSDGACDRIPANQPGVAVPRKARVGAYPTQERYGLVWTFLGDLPEAERPPLPLLNDFATPGLCALRGDYGWQAHCSAAWSAYPYQGCRMRPEYVPPTSAVASTFSTPSRPFDKIAVAVMAPPAAVSPRNTRSALVGSPSMLPPKFRSARKISRKVPGGYLSLPFSSPVPLALMRMRCPPRVCD